MNFNYTPINKTLIYSCAYGYFKNAKEKKSYIDKLDSKMNIVFSNSNFAQVHYIMQLTKKMRRDTLFLRASGGMADTYA